MKITEVLSFDQTLKDLYPLPGERMKQWVVDDRIAAKWDRDTCPCVEVERHKDNTEGECLHVGQVQWLSLLWANECDTCSDIADAARERDDVKAWLVRRETERPKICEDRTKLSDEIAPDLSLRDHWLFEVISKRGAK